MRKIKSRWQVVAGDALEDAARHLDDVGEGARVLDDVADASKYADDMLKSNINSYRQAILNGDITKPTGGKINSKVITAAIDTNIGDIYYGISGMNNNPTRNAGNIR